MANGNGGNGDESGSKDRSTVALVASEVREVKAIISGHAELTAEQLRGLGEKIKPLVEIPDRVTRIEARLDNLENNRAWARGVVVTLILAGAGTLVNLAINLHWFG